MWRRKWEPISGRVIAAEVAKVYGGGSMGQSQTKWKYVVEYRVDGGEPRRVELEQAWGFLAKKMINPPEGSTVPLLFDRRSGEVHFDVKNPALNWKATYKADKARRQAEYDKALKD